MHFIQWLAEIFNHHVQLSKNQQMGLYCYIFLVSPSEVITVSHLPDVMMFSSKESLQDASGSIRRK